MALSAETQEKIRAEQARFPNPRGALLAAIYLARDDLGALGPEAFAELAPLFGMRANEVAEVASFYSLFNLPRAQAVIQVCTNLPCCLRGARGVVRELEHRLGIKAGTATPDGRFAIAEVRMPRLMRDRAGRAGEPQSVSGKRNAGVGGDPA